MRFVNFPKIEENGNVEVYQYQDEIYYRTIRDIHPDNEMLVVYGADYGKKLLTLSHRDEAMDSPSYSLLNNPFRNAEENCKNTLVDNEMIDQVGNQEENCKNTLVDNEIIDQVGNQEENCKNTLVDNEMIDQMGNQVDDPGDSSRELSVENPMTDPGNSSMDNPVVDPIDIAVDNLVNEAVKNPIDNLVDNQDKILCGAIEDIHPTNELLVSYGDDSGKVLSALSHTDEPMDLPSCSSLNNAEENYQKTPVDNEIIDQVGNQVDRDSSMDHSLENPMTDSEDTPGDSSMDNPVVDPIDIAVDNFVNEAVKNPIDNLVDNQDKISCQAIKDIHPANELLVSGKVLPALSLTDKPMDPPSYTVLNNPLSNTEENCKKTLVDNGIIDQVGNQVDGDSLMDYSLENPMTDPGDNPVDNSGDNPEDSSVYNPVVDPIDIAVDNLVNEALKNPTDNLVDDQADNSVDNSMDNSSQLEISSGIPVDNSVNTSVDNHVESEDVDMLIENKLKRYNLQDMNFNVEIVNHEYSPGRSLGKPFKCPHCDRCFRTKGYLKLHRETHSGDRPFECFKCERTFRLQSHLVQHIATHSEERPFECTRCDKIFRLKRHLQEHIPTHSRRKPFQCSLCEKSFRLKSHLQQHKMTHSENKLYKCEECGKSFHGGNNLTHHLKTHS